MTQHKFARTTAAVVATLLLLACATTADALENIRLTDTKTFNVGTEPEIDLSAVSGDVTYEVTSGTEAKVEIVTIVRADDEDEARQIQEMIDVTVDGRDGLLEAYVEYPDDFSHDLRREFGRDRSISVSFHVTGPKGASGHMSSVSGDVRVDGVTGPLKLNAVSGNVTAKNIERRVAAKSVSGEVDVSDCADRVSASSVSGDITVTNCDNEVEAGTTSGDIELTGIGGDVLANSTSGNIDVDHRSGGLSAETVSGDISVRSESSSGALGMESLSGSVELFADTDKIGRVALSTYSGDIHMKGDRADRKRMRDGFNGRGDLHLTLGNGDLDIRAKTHSGDIWIREL